MFNNMFCCLKNMPFTFHVVHGVWGGQWRQLNEECWCVFVFSATQVQIKGNVVYSNYTVPIEVIPTPPICVIDGGNNIFISSRNNSLITLNGEGSFDPDYPESILRYCWEGLIKVCHVQYSAIALFPVKYKVSSVWCLYWWVYYVLSVLCDVLHHSAFISITALLGIVLLSVESTHRALTTMFPPPPPHSQFQPSSLKADLTSFSLR